MAPSPEMDSQSTSILGVENPSTTDWAVLAEFWGWSTLPGAYLHRPLEVWLHPTHHKWIWFHDQTNDILERVLDDGLEYYMPRGVKRTCSERVYLLPSFMLKNCLKYGVPCTTVLTVNSSV